MLKIPYPVTVDQYERKQLLLSIVETASNGSLGKGLGLVVNFQWPCAKKNMTME